MDFAGIFSGTTATLVIVDGWTVTAACVGDSRCVLDAQGVVTALTIDHRFDTNDEECVSPSTGFMLDTYSGLDFISATSTMVDSTVPPGCCTGGIAS